MPKKPSKRKQLKFSQEELQQLDKQTLVSMVLKMHEQFEQISEQMQFLINERYGPKTERRDDPNQLRIIEEPNRESDQESQAEAPEPKKKPGHGRNPMPSHLPRKQIKRPPTPSELLCACGGHRRKINEVVRSQRFECLPATYYIEEIVDCVWQCVDCNDTVVIEAEPFEPIAGQQDHICSVR